VRPPLQPISEEERRLLREALEEVELLEKVAA
jgi:dihydrodipicolinate synthase/N-acetylneuraminate lyase